VSPTLNTIEDQDKPAERGKLKERIQALKTQIAILTAELKYLETYSSKAKPPKKPGR
jgi:hypothetical protein